MSVEDYVASIKPAARATFDELRALVRATLPEAREVVSYGVLGYKLDNKRARFFIGAAKDHVAIYPVPQDEALAAALKPYRKGKGTLWFSLDQPLPTELIGRVVRALSGVV